MEIEEMGVKTFTLKEFAEAMKKNGYPQISKEYIRYNDNKEVIAACAFGQAAINLGVHPEDLHNMVSSRGIYETNITALNDYGNYSVPEIADMVLDEIKRKNISDRHITMRTAEYKIADAKTE